MTDEDIQDGSATKLAACESVIDYRFGDRGLLRRCLTHASVAKTRLDSNERLEFLGDAILGMIVCKTLYQRFPKHPEGELTRLKSSLVSGATCARIAGELGLDRFLFLGKGISGGSGMPSSILAAAVEALIAGIYLDGGFDPAQNFVESILRTEFDAAGELHQRGNYKSVLQQLAQKNFGVTPLYQVLDEKGPDHSKCFNVAATISGRVFSSAWGGSKKEAEQGAARNALSEIRAENGAESAD